MRFAPPPAAVAVDASRAPAVGARGGRGGDSGLRRASCSAHCGRKVPSIELLLLAEVVVTVLLLAEVVVTVLLLAEVVVTE